MVSIENIINLKNIDKQEYVYNCDNNTKLKIIKINNIFDKMFVHYLYKSITKIPDKNWFSISGMENTKHEGKIINKNKKKNNHFIKESYKLFSDNKFSYTFHKTMIYTKTEISKFELLLRNILSSKLFISFLNHITNNKLNLTRLNTMFLSRYKSGHFLAPHSDINNGKLAFVFNLTKNWKPQYGGILHFLNTNRTDILHSFVPSFNNLLIFEVPKEGIPHYVSHIAPLVKYNRYALTGWYK